MREEQKPIKIHEHSTSEKTILLIEDSPIFSRIFIHAIKKNTPYQVVHLTDGSQIIQVITEIRPNLLVLDYDLPGEMNGIEIYDLVHGTQGWEHIPAIMISANLPLKEIERRHIPGLYKPCGTDEFLSALSKLLP
ncbi:response regulator [Ktedonosporobacter rubrisoli]|uniref:Response regulator n=1 Tax=Ktedonosporobacter rubrisoli TaxID=2509675 RepID=A0A4P6JYS5_KTERU|nr:response regulator [Ktedonosporobacter rubrisoli]QBD80206.1 response regulator [Ktedonosporobacter rubrisoli]